MKKTLKLLAASVTLLVFATLVFLLPKLNATAEGNENVELVWETNEDSGYDITTDPILHGTAADLKKTDDGGFIIAAQSYVSYTPEAHSGVYYAASLFKYDTDGNREWKAMHQNDPLGEQSYFTSVVQISNNEYMAVGYHNNPMNSSDGKTGIVSKFAVNGNTVTETETWHLRYESKKTFLTAIVLDDDGNFVISGMTDAKLFYFKLKSSHACSIAADNICDEDIAWKVDYEDAYASTTIDTTTSNPYNYVNRVHKIDAGEFLIFDKIGNDGGSIVKITESETGDSVTQVKNEFTAPGIGVESALDNEYLWFGKQISGTSYINYWNFGNTLSERDLKGGRYFVPVSASYSNPSGSSVVGMRAIPTIDNQYLVLGEYIANYHGGADLLKVDSNRNILWQHRDDTSDVDNYWMAGESMGDGTYVVVSNTGMIRKYRDKTTYNWIRYNIVGETDPEYVDVYALMGQSTGDAHYYTATCQRPGRVSVKNGGTFSLNSIYSNGCNFFGSNPYIGFEFSGWYTDPSLDPATKIDDSFDLTANRNIELYGSYEKQEFQIPFYVLTDEDDGNEPTVTENSVQTLEVYDMVLLPEIEVPEGYAFDGWYDGKIVDGERVYNTENKHAEDFAYVFTYASPNSSDHFDFLYAKVTKKKTFEIPFYTVTYEEEGSAPTAVADSVQSGYVGDTITLPTVEVPEDYEMKGWFGGNIVEGEPVYNTTKQFTEDFVYSESEIGQYDFIYAKIVKKPVYHVPFYLVVYEDTSYTTIKEVVEIEGAKNDYRIGDYLEFPNFNTAKYSRQNYYWYGGKVVDGEKVYNSSPSLYERTNYYTYTQNYVTQFDFLYTRVTLRSISVHFGIKDDYSYYDGNGNWTQAHYCGDYSSEMTTYPDETISWGGTITTEIKTASPDGSCVLGSLKLADSSYSSSGIDYTPDMPIETSYYGYVYIVGKYIPNYLVVRDDKVYYASGEEYDVEADENLFWNPETNTLTLENYTTMDILFANGEEPINLVLNGTNDTQIRSSTTPIVISGTGSLANATPMQGSDTAYAAIDANGTSIVIESGKIENNIFADNVMVNGGETSENIIVCYGNGYDEASCGVVVNGGNISSIRAFYGDIYIYDGLFKIGSSIEAEDGDLVIESGIFNSSGFEGDRIIINGGSISGMSSVETEVFMMNGGNIDVTIPDRFRVENYFIMNDGALKVKAVSEDPAIYVRNGYAIFNGGTADIAGVVPMAVDYPGAFEEKLATAGMELNEETIAELKARLGDYLPTRGAGVEINGGDVTFGTVKKDELIDLAVDAYMAGFEEDMMSNMPSTDEEVAEICLDAAGEEGDMMFSHYKTWRIDISGLTLVPMDDGEGGQVMLPELDMNTGNALIDEEGNPIFIPLYNAVDGEGNVIYSKVGQGVDENGNTFYFKAGFNDENDCKNNFLTVYPDLMRLYYREYMRQRAESEFADVQEYPMAFMLGKNGSDDIIDESAIYINPELFKDPEVIEISPITVSGEDSTQYFVTFGDGEGEPSFDPEALTSEHLLMRARFYEDDKLTPPIPNTDGEDDNTPSENSTEQNSSEKVGNLGHEQVESSSAVANILVGIVAIVLTTVSIAIYRKRH